jgi:DNA-binding transcriptional LysR family regulator
MMDWDKLRVFHAVAEAGSFTHAGDRLNLSQSAVSRQISSLEDSLNVPLFHRHARGLILTEQGELLHRTETEVFAKLSLTEAMLTESKDKAKGPLTVNCTLAFGTTWLAPRVKEFREMYPEVELSIVLSDTELDLAMREADVAIRMTPPKQPELIQRHLMTVHFHLYASRDYIERRGMPKNASELKDHDIIAYSGDHRAPIPYVNWAMEVGSPPPGERRPALRINNLYAMSVAVQSGLGIASIPDYMITDPNVVRVATEDESPKLEAFFVYAEELRQSKRIAAFRDFLVQKLAEAEDFRQQ